MSNHEEKAKGNVNALIQLMEHFAKDLEKANEAGALTPEEYAVQLDYQEKAKALFNEWFPTMKKWL